MLEICRQLFTQWNSHSVSYCHWKSNEHLLEGLNGETDLDVYVSPTDKEKAETLLKKCFYIECCTQKEHHYPNVFEWMGFDPTTGRLVHVHLHYQIITGTPFCKEYIFPVNDLIISTRVLDSETGVYVTNPNLEIILLHCRIALKAKNKLDIHLNKADQREISFLKERIEEDFVHNLCKMLIGNNGDIFFSIISKKNLSCEEWNKLYLIAEGWLKPYRKYSKYHVFVRYHYYMLRKRVFRLAETKFHYHVINKKTFPCSNLSICFIGQDGSGKSTITMELCKWFNWKLEAKRFYLGSGEHYSSTINNVLSKLSRIKNGEYLSKDNKKTKVTGFTKEKKKGIRSIFRSCISAYKMLGTAKNAYYEVRKADYYMRKGGIPLFDRFPQIQFEGIYDGPKIADTFINKGLDNFIIRWMAKKEYRFINKIQEYQPTLVFKLILSPEESIRRKPYENFNMVSKKHEITELINFPNSEVYVVDATQEYKEELLYIKRLIWKKLVEINL